MAITKRSNVGRVRRILARKIEAALVLKYGVPAEVDPADLDSQNPFYSHNDCCSWCGWGYLLPANQRRIRVALCSWTVMSVFMKEPVTFCEEDHGYGYDLEIA